MLLDLGVVALALASTAQLHNYCEDKKKFGHPNAHKIRAIAQALTR
jgi:hypothetical protein